MQFVGFDSCKIERSPPLIEEEAKLKPFKALLGVAISTSDENGFRKAYDSTLSEVFEKYRITRKKLVYKSAHLLKQISGRASDVIHDLIGDLNPVIDRVDVFCAYFGLKQISMYGSARGQRVPTMTFIDRIENAFPHVCAWKYLKRYNPRDCVFQIDHFEGKMTPAWEELESSKVKMEIYYSGSECNALISIADLMLKYIDTFQFGKVDGESLLKPIRSKIDVLRDKLGFSNLGLVEDLKKYDPSIPLDIDTTRYLKHPIFYIVWNPKEPRTIVKPSFELSDTYNTIMKQAFEVKGGVKLLELGKDELKWEPKIDFLVPWSEVDLETVELLKKMHTEVPRILTPKELKK